jgi:restriction system protein
MKIDDIDLTSLRAIWERRRKAAATLRARTDPRGASRPPRDPEEHAFLRDRAAQGPFVEVERPGWEEWRSRTHPAGRASSGPDHPLPAGTADGASAHRLNPPMAIPDFQTVMLPLLRVAADGAEHSKRESVEALASEFGLTDEERHELLPSGRQATFDNRVAWAATYLKKAGLLESTRRAHFRITDRGRSVLSENPSRVDMKLLERFPEYLEFRSRRSSNGGPTAAAVEEPADEQTPEEAIESGYQRIRGELADEILQQIMACSPAFFEQLVIDLLVRMGYGGTRKDAGQAVGRSGDGGIDGIIKEDRLGLGVIYLQAKRWEGAVGRPEIQKFVGALQGQRARRGVFITTSSFTKEAVQYTAMIENKVVLIDGEMLAQLMIDHGVGVSSVATYEVKRVDSDYFAEA